MQFGLLPRKKIGKIFLVLGIFLFPLFSCLYIVSIYSSGLISEKLSLLVLLIAVFSFYHEQNKFQDIISKIQIYRGKRYPYTVNNKWESE